MAKSVPKEETITSKRNNPQISIEEVLHLTSPLEYCQYDEDVDSDLLCPICLRPVIDPHVWNINCQHDMCHGHLSSLQMCPVCRDPKPAPVPSSLFLRRKLATLVVTCPFPNCSTRVERNHLEQHVRSCANYGPRLDLCYRTDSARDLLIDDEETHWNKF